jgi:gluconolactonase
MTWGGAPKHEIGRSANLALLLYFLRRQTKGKGMQRLFTLILLAMFCDRALPQSSGDRNILPEGSKLEMLFTGGVLTEGPASAPDGAIYFSDITFTSVSGMQAGHIMKFDPRTGKTTVFRSPSGMSNGIKFDAQGRMIVAEGADYGGRRVTRTDLSTGKCEILAGLYEGRPLNSPNDIAIDEKGRIYFSDPRYLGHEPIDQPLMAVYRIDPDRSIHRIITDAGKPNGIAISPDQKTLYVGCNENGTTGMFRVPVGTPLRKGRMLLLAYDLNPDGTAQFRKTLVDYSPEDGPDGLTVDVEGNLYVAVRAVSSPGIYVYYPSGEELARIPTPVLPTNVGFGFGDESKTLYITAGGDLYRIKTNKVGYRLPAK